MHLGIKRLKQRLGAGFGDVQKCSKTTTTLMRDARLLKSARLQELVRCILMMKKRGKKEETQEVEVTPNRLNIIKCIFMHPSSKFWVNFQKEEIWSGLNFKRTITLVIKKTPEVIRGG
jgi:hypothetical protein